MLPPSYLPNSLSPAAQSAALHSSLLYCRGFRPAVFPIAPAPFAQKSLSINLDTHVHEAHHHLDISPFKARLPLGSPWAVSLIAKLRIERQEGSTPSAPFSPLLPDLTLSDPTDCMPKAAAVPRHNT